jgi:hypothetical protein
MRSSLLEIGTEQPQNLAHLHLVKIAIQIWICEPLPWAERTEETLVQKLV